MLFSAGCHGAQKAALDILGVVAFQRLCTFSLLFYPIFHSEAQQEAPGRPGNKAARVLIPWRMGLSLVRGPPSLARPPSLLGVFPLPSPFHFVPDLDRMGAALRKANPSRRRGSTHNTWWGTWKRFVASKHRPPSRCCRRTKGEVRKAGKSRKIFPDKLAGGGARNRGAPALRQLRASWTMLCLDVPSLRRRQRPRCAGAEQVQVGAASMFPAFSGPLSLHILDHNRPLARQRRILSKVLNDPHNQ